MVRSVVGVAWASGCVGAAIGIAACGLDVTGGATATTNVADGGGEGEGGAPDLDGANGAGGDAAPNGKGSEDGGGARPDADAGAPALGRCDPNKGFGEPVPVPGLSNNDSEEGHAWLSEDELTAYLVIGAGNAREIFTATRPAVTDAFGSRTAVAALAAANVDDDNVCLTADLRTVFFASPRSPSQSWDIWTASRSSPTSAFDPPRRLGNDINTTAVDGDPFVLPNGAAVYFDSLRSATADNDDDVYVTRRPAGGGPLGPATKVGGVNLPASSDRHPVVAADELTIIFTSNRNPAETNGDLFIATRERVADPFGTPRHLPTLSSMQQDLATWISADACVLYFSSDRRGTRDIFRAARPR